MSEEQLVADLVNRLPDDATLHDITREIDFVAGVREGLAQLDRGEGAPSEEVAHQLAQWLAK